MKRPRIIIADTDSNYIVPLQLKFAEEFFDKVDLEIITDPAYFSELFSVPQTADILIVSEELFDRSLLRHVFGSVFVLTEQETQEHSGRVRRLFKYTSIQEIFAQFRAHSGGVLEQTQEERRGPQILLVFSAVGGVGKTTVAMGLAAALAAEGRRIVYLGAERLQSFQYRLKQPQYLTSSAVLNALHSDTQLSFEQLRPAIANDVFSYLPPFRAPLMALGLSYGIYEAAAAAAKQSGEFDAVIVDADSVFDEEKARLMDLADRVILITRQTPRAVAATEALAANINGLSREKYIFLCNDFDAARGNALAASDLRFSVDDYIPHFAEYDRLTNRDLAREESIRRLAFLML